MDARPSLDARGARAARPSPAARDLVRGDERPRERLASRGAASLTDAELVAVVLGCGAPGATALDVARALIERVGGLPGLARATPATLASG